MPQSSASQSLHENHERWLSKFIAKALDCKVITNQDLLEIYPPKAIFGAYAEEPVSRGMLLTKVFHFGRKTAETLDVGTCITLFDAAIDKNDLTADQVFGIVSPDEIVRVLDRTAVWKLIHEKKWHEKPTEAHRALMAHALGDFVDEKLEDDSTTSSLKLIEKRLGFENYVEHLPKPVLVEILRLARTRADGRARGEDSSSAANMIGGIAFSADVLAEVASPSVLAQHLPLELCYGVLTHAAEKFGWLEAPAQPVTDAPPAPAEGGDEPEIVVEGARESAAPPPLSFDDEEDEDDRTVVRGNPLLGDEEGNNGVSSRRKKKSGPPPLPKPR